MSILTGAEIVRQRELGNITISPFDPAQLNPNSYNIRLGKTLLVYDEIVLDMRKKPHTREYPLSLGAEFWRLMPGVGYLGVTAEIVGSSKYVPILHGRSTVGRYFLFLHVTAGLGDLGYCNHWTLELVNSSGIPLKIYPGMLIGQFSFETIEGEISQTYDQASAYMQLSDKPIGPKQIL